jgi:hypothetical protein
MELELAAMREITKSAKPSRKRGSNEISPEEGSRFVELPDLVPGCVFLHITDSTIDPVVLVVAILEHVLRTGSRLTRYSLRLQPVQATCFSDMEV